MKKAYFRIYETVTAGVVCAIIVALGKAYIDLRSYEARLVNLEKKNKSYEQVMERFTIDENSQVSLVLDDFRIINSASTKD